MTTFLVFLELAARAQEPVTPEDLRGILTFRDEHLSIREQRTVVPGRMTVLGSGWGWGPLPWRGYTWTPTSVVQSPPEIYESWAIYRGPQRLSVPQFLESVGQPLEAVALERRIRRNSTTGKVFGGLAVLGLAAGLGGIVGSFVDTPIGQPTWTTVGLSGLGTSLVSSIVSGATGSRANKLASDFTETQDLGRVQEQVRDYNEELRNELGLTPAQAYRELDAPQRRSRGQSP